MSKRGSAEPLLHYFEPHEIADLKEAFKFDEGAENDFLKGNLTLHSNKIHVLRVLNL